MRVLYDGVAFQNAHQRGVQRVFRELIGRLPRDVEATLALTGPARSELPTGARVIRAGVPMAGLLPRRLRSMVQARLAPIGLGRAAASCDVFHSTYYTLPPRGLPSVVHVHDMIVERFVDLFQGKWVAEEIERKRGSIEAATRIIAVSNATARELAHFYPGVREKITTVHLAGGHVADAGAGEPARPRERFALYVGDRGLYKNFQVVLDAMESERWPSGVGLTVVGPPWKANEALRVERLGRSRRIVHGGRVSDQELARLYRAATCVVVPSVVEGFGLPVLEAQQARAPLVCSDIEVFREVAGEGAIFFDPHRPDQLAERIGAAMDPAMSARLAESGARNQARFSWDRAITETVAVYRSVCQA